MKKIISVFCSLMAMFSPVYMSAADGGDDPQFRFGAEVDVVMSKPTDYAKSTGAGFGIGVVGEYDFTSSSRGLFIGSGLSLTSRPWHSVTFTNMEPGDTDPIKLRQKATPYYLRLPVNVGYRFALSSVWSLHIQTGPYVSVGLFGKSKQSLSMVLADGYNQTYNDKVDCYDEIYRRFDWGWTAGFGVQLKESWQLNCRGNYQFNSFLKDGIKSHNRSIEIGVAYYF